MLAWFTGLFWSRQFWLPQNVTWEDLESTTAAVFPKRSEFAYSLLIGVALLVRDADKGGKESERERGLVVNETARGLLKKVSTPYTMPYTSLI